MARIIVLTLALLAVIQFVMSTNPPSIEEFFKEKVRANLTTITWKHAVNNKALLNSSLASNVMMLEADVVLGNLQSNATKLMPIMAHPPNTTSDLSLEEFIEIVLKNGTKGMKLDFKSIEAFNQSSEILKKFKPNMKVPVWINADILMGPVNATEEQAKPVDVKQFLSTIVKDFPEFVVSVGWVTKYGTKYNIKTGNYTTYQVEDMLKVLKDNHINQNVTFAVRAGLALNSIDAMEKLVANNNKATLTIWSSEGDEVNGDKLTNLITKIGFNKVFIDVPESVWKTLHFNKPETGASNYLTSNVVLTFATTILSFLLVTRML